MRPVHFILSTSLLVAGAAIWFCLQVSEAASLRSELHSVQMANAQSAVPAGTSSPAPGEDVSLLKRQIAELREAVARENSEAKAAETSLAEIRQKLPPIAEGETVVSLGRVADMGKEAAQAIRGISSLVSRSNGSIDDKEKAQASFMKLVAWMPEIAGFEDRPEEMASFQASLFQELFDLDQPRARQIELILKTHFDAVHAAGLTAANSAQPTWRERRTAALTSLLWQLKPFVPQNFKSPEILGQIVNVGAGLESRTETHISKEPGKSRHYVSMSLPSWPKVPWLPQKNMPK